MQVEALILVQAMYSTLYYNVLYCAVLYCTVLYCTLYCTIIINVSIFGITSLTVQNNN